MGNVRARRRVVKLLTFGELRRKVIRTLPWLAERWVACNDVIFDLFLDTRWEIEGVEDLRRDEHYLVISNHISWIDIFAVLRAFHLRAPFIRFFLKHTLAWAPFAGQAAWALGFRSCAATRRSTWRSIRRSAAAIWRRRAWPAAASAISPSRSSTCRGDALLAREARGPGIAVSLCSARASAGSVSCWPRWPSRSTRCTTSPSSIRSSA